MKPQNWNELTDEQKKEYAAALFASPRGLLVMSQALHYGIQKMNEVPDPYKEVSNIQDIEMLRETFFNFPIFEPSEERKKIKAIQDERYK